MAGNSNFQNIQITYVSPGAQPPIFVAGSFTDPPWQPQELDYVLEQLDDMRTGNQSKSSQYRFVKRFQVGEGTWQYKFRLGLGDWWVCDDHTEKITDESGNENNLLTVKAPRLSSRRPDHVIEDGDLGEENGQSTLIQRGVNEKEVAEQKSQSEAGRSGPSRTLDYDIESNEVEDSDARPSPQKSNYSQLPHKQLTFEDKTPASLDSEGKHAKLFNGFQVKPQEEEPSLLEKFISERDGAERQSLQSQSGADQGGSLRQRTSGKPFLASSLESSNNPKPSKGDFGSFWERLLQWLYSVFTRLFSSQRS